jgi:Flp pilus assembly protein TadG
MRNRLNLQRARLNLHRGHLGRRQRGQAMTEFVAAMALFIPLFLGLIYVFKYNDIKHQAIQASRYAAMERALDPSDGAVETHTRARFFRDGKNAITANDNASEPTAGDENPNWDQLNGTPMLNSYSDVAVSFKATPVDSPWLTVPNAGASMFSGLQTGFGTQADVNVPLANVADFAPLSNIGMTIHATTVIAGDTWSGGGPAEVASHFTWKTNTGKAMTWANNAAFTLLFDAFAGSAPVWGCIKPDIVPETVAPGASYQSTQDGGINQCY